MAGRLSRSNEELSRSINVVLLLLVFGMVIAIVIASPVAYYFMQRWLSDFVHHIEIKGWMFAAAGLLAISIALLTVGFQSVKAALTNPVKSLRSE